MEGNLCRELEVDLRSMPSPTSFRSSTSSSKVTAASAHLLHLTFPPGSPGPQFFWEKFVKVDDKSRVKEAMVTEGGLLELGFSSYITRFEIAERGSGSCTIKSTIEYEVDEEHVANASFITADALAAIAKAAAEHLIEHRSCVAN